jgi:hypothetical protein
MTDEENKLIKMNPEILTYIDNTDLDSLTYDDLVQLGREALEVKTYTQWLTGKLGDYISSNKTGKYGDLERYAKDINMKYGVLWQYVTVYRRFTEEDPNFSPDAYKGSMPWGVFALVAQHSDTPATTLNELSDKGVTNIEHAYRELKTKQTGKELPRKPKISLVYSEEANKWRIRMNPLEFDDIDWGDIREQLMAYLEGII